MKFVVDLHQFRYVTGTQIPVHLSRQKGTQTSPKQYHGGGGGGVLVFVVDFP